MNQFKLKIMAMNKTFYFGMCAKLMVETIDGKFEILAQHEPVVLSVVPGTLRYSIEGDEWIDVVNGSGFVTVSENQVMVIVDTAEKPEDIDVIRAKEAKIRAEEQLLHINSQREYLHSKASLARAMVRLKATSKYRER